jgi:hypothetical protein
VGQSRLKRFKSRLSKKDERILFKLNHAMLN